ncbi:hypothetical protein [Cyanobium sp. Morenito 9A2]|uniref:hypothetical protein n=1 Tax=Cyanobium sp. Morenito 9A2 TaxID=2823718 RepID=UPI0020CEFBBC|nr:hypothetical protein [Cyanobium sp. Morenito 9A2]MCP9848787.1 hypothetical protein [Cyanobium sp. Morenito 9A2]
MSLSNPSADQVWERFGLGSACVAERFQLGWIGPDSNQNLGSFTGSLLSTAATGLSCQLARHTDLDPLQAFLILGLLLTFGLSALACRWSGFRSDTSLITAFLITTAPCAFSRVGHLSLATLWAVIPGLLACHGLWRSLDSPRKPLGLVGAGAIAALLCLPTQDYYVFFTLLLLFCSFGLLVVLAATRTTELRHLGGIASRGLLFAGGFFLVLLLLYAPKLLLLTQAGTGPPPFWATPRYAIEQFQYGLLPFTWVIPSPWVAVVQKAFEDGGISTGTENYFWSTGSFLIPIAWGVALWTVARERQRPPQAGLPLQRVRGLGHRDLLFFALLLFITTFVGLFWMTMGGLGTLFAVVVSPVLRSLTRFTAFEYGAAVLMLTALLDRCLSARTLGQGPWALKP